MTLVHASCVAFGDVGILIRGKSGSGKSSLCLRLIDGEGFGLGAKALRAELVADDQVELSLRSKTLFAAAPAALAGKLEIRGLGIVSLPYRLEVALRLIVDLRPASEIERLPGAAQQRTVVADVSLPCLALNATETVSAARLRAALGHYGLL